VPFFVLSSILANPFPQPLDAPQGTYKVRDNNCVIRYLRHPFHKEPDFAVTSVNYDLRELWQQGTEPF
jgi:hypothetical protein